MILRSLKINSKIIIFNNNNNNKFRKEEIVSKLAEEEEDYEKRYTALSKEIANLRQKVQFFN